MLTPQEGGERGLTHVRTKPRCSFLPRSPSVETPQQDGGGARCEAEGARGAAADAHRQSASTLRRRQSRSGPMAATDPRSARACFCTLLTRRRVN